MPRAGREARSYIGPWLNIVDLCDSLDDSDQCQIPPRDHIPRSSSDTALTAFAQLSAIRLGASRALISLIDQSKQYVLAEATQSLSLQSDTRHDTDDELWLGSAIIPRNKGVCENVLASDAGVPVVGTPGVMVIKDLEQDERFRERLYVKGYPRFRFYVGVLLRSPLKFKVGVLSVFDSKPRDAVDPESLSFLQDMAVTVMDHLEHCKVKEQHRRGEQLVRGLGSFVQGLSALKDYESDDARFVNGEGDSDVEDKLPGTPYSSSRSHKQLVVPMEVSLRPSDSSQPDAPSTDKSADTSVNEDPFLDRRQPDQRPQTAEQMKHASAESMDARHSMLPTGSAKFFSRAAKIICQSSNFDGVTFFDASLVDVDSQDRDAEPRRLRIRQTSNSDTSRASSALSSTRSGDSIADINDSSQSEDLGVLSDVDLHEQQRQMNCPLLGFATAHLASTSADAVAPNLLAFPRRELRRLVRKHPEGKIFNISEQGAVSLSDESASDATVTPSGTAKKVSNDSGQPNQGTSSEFLAMMAFAPQARSIIALPLWDYERERWSAVCVCWTNSTIFNLTAGHDLLYLKVFGNSLMIGVSKLDALATDKAKTTFVASISHELRSPLHGILGGVEFLQDTTIDNFQAGMLNSIESCGRTLLDTVDHVLEFAKINNFTRSKPKGAFKAKSSYHVKFGSSKRNTGIHELPSLISDVNLAILTEEVTEAIYSSAIFKNHSADSDNSWHSVPSAALRTTSAPQSREVNVGRTADNPVRVLLHIPFRESWTCSTQPGAWRRILMNLLGNSLKYTRSGFIYVALGSHESKSGGEGRKRPITLTITDTGQGISPEYLQSRLFSPFTQENPFSAGTGLGLSIVRQLVQSLGGTVNVKSLLGTGTQVKITFNPIQTPILSDPMSISTHESPAAIALQLQGRKIGLVEPSIDKAGLERFPPAMRPVIEQNTSLRTIFQEWLQVEVNSLQSIDDIQAELVVWTEPTVEQLTAIASRSKVPDLLIVCRSAIDAFEVVRKVKRLTTGYVDVIIQPCGPHKIAKALHQWLRPSALDLPRQSMTSPSRLRKVSSSDSGINITGAATNTSSPRRLKSRVAGSPVALQDSISSHLKSIQDSESSPKVGKKKLRVLIVDDNPINLKLAAVYIKKRAFDYVEATDGLQAFEAYKKGAGKFDFVLMDLSMPVMDGIESSQAIREFEKEHGLPAATIIAMTGLATAQAQADASKSGIDHYFTKPVRFKDLESVIK